MITLRVVVDEILAPTPSGASRYAEELTRELIRTAPASCTVEGLVAASPGSDYDRLHTLLPGLANLHKSSLARRELALAWQHGFTRLAGPGMIHAPSLLAPLSRHDRVNNTGEQVVVTIHDVIAWSHPDTMPSSHSAWQRAMAKRARKFADAIVVPSHSVAAELAEIMDFGDRIRVIPGAVSSKLSLPIDADERARALGLPDRYLVAVGSLDSRKGIASLIEALGHPDAVDLPLFVVGPPATGDTTLQSAAAAAGLAADRVTSLGVLNDADLSVALARATVFVFPSIAEGFGLPVIEAFHFGTPVVHSDAPAVVEVSDGAGLTVAVDDVSGYPERLAAAIRSVVDNPALAERMSFAGRDRAAAFSWRDSARQVWQLHADL